MRNHDLIVLSYTPLRYVVQDVQEVVFATAVKTLLNFIGNLHNNKVIIAPLFSHYLHICTCDS